MVAISPLSVWPSPTPQEGSSCREECLPSPDRERDRVHTPAQRYVHPLEHGCVHSLFPAAYKGGFTPSQLSETARRRCGLGSSHTSAPGFCSFLTEKRLSSARPGITYVTNTCAYTNTPPYPALGPTREQLCEQDRSQPSEHLLNIAERKGLLRAASLSLPTFAPKAEDIGVFAS